MIKHEKTKSSPSNIINPEAYTSQQHGVLVLVHAQSPTVGEFLVEVNLKDNG